MLQPYKKKRDFKLTPEPAPKKAQRERTGPLTFVVQKHSATRLHYDFRLEVDGVLKSWAVPKGPSLNPSEKRFAAMTEDHPLDYASFEGVIPEGAYGAGPVIVWDSGTYAPDEDGQVDFDDRLVAEKKMHEGLKKGKLSFVLQGEKLKGSWTLVRMRDKQKDWLLIKHKDEFAATEDVLVEEQSVLSDRTIEDVQTGRSGKRARKVDAVKGSLSAPFPTKFSPMLASLADQPFSNPDWLFEPKMDGIRAIAMITERHVKLMSRRGLEITQQYPSLVSQLKKHTQKGLILDGEIVALNDKGQPSFQKLQQRMGLTSPADIKAAESRILVYYYVFDIMYLNGKDLRRVPLKDRKSLLEQTLVTSERVQLLPHFVADGEKTYEASVTHGLEGIVAKRLDSMYESGRRSRNWMKIKTTTSAEFVIGGYTVGLRARSHTFGSLMLGNYDNRGHLVYAGNVGTGFNDKLLRELLAQLESLKIGNCPFVRKPPGRGKNVWVEPKLVAEIKFAEWTADGLLRAPVFMRLRTDIHSKDVSRTEVIEVRGGAGDADAVDESVDESVIEQLSNDKENLKLTVGGFTIPLTNLNKVFWPAHKRRSPIAKRDLLIYFTRVAPYLLPHLRDRPLTLVRYPNGIDGGKFYQKHWGHKLPEYVDAVDLFSEHNNADAEYLICNNLATLLWLGQIADIELHSWMARVSPEPDAGNLPAKFTGSAKNIDSSLLNYPDYMIFDLDPYIYSGKESSGEEPALNRKAFKKTCEVALMIKDILDSLALKAYLKTTGKTGLHLFLPMLRDYNYDEVRAAADAMGRFILSQRPKDVTMEWSVAKRPGKIFFDHNMNARGKTLASIYSPRAASGAPVSVPISWDELSEVYPTDFTLRTVPERLKKKGDLWADILENKNDLSALLRL